MFGPQFIYMWVMSQSYKLGLKLSLVCLLQALIREPPSSFPQLLYVSLCFSLCLSLPNFSNLLLFTLFHLLQSFVSQVIIIIFPIHTYSYIHQNPKGSSQLQRILLELVPDAKQCSTTNFPKQCSAAITDLIMFVSYLDFPRHWLMLSQPFKTSSGGCPFGPSSRPQGWAHCDRARS